MNASISYEDGTYTVRIGRMTATLPACGCDRPSCVKRHSPRVCQGCHGVHAERVAAYAAEIEKGFGVPVPRTRAVPGGEGWKWSTTGRKPPQGVGWFG